MVRLTYSIDMALSPNTPVSTSFTSAAAAAGASTSDMQSVYNSIKSKNPSIASGTVIEAFDAVVSALAAKNIMVVLDNQVSKASWCCSTTDGNGWWNTASGYDASNSQYFNTQNWINGLSAMAT